jgi:DNA polymerase III epsilon subunit-like protein
MAINSIICIDVETGGLHPSKNPVTQIAYQAFELDTYKPLLEFSSYIKPYDTGLVYEPKAMDYTGITAQHLASGLDLKSVVKQMWEDFSRVTSSHTKKPILLGHNVGFDIGFIKQVFNYCKVDIAKVLDCNHDIPKSIDTLSLAKQKWAKDEKVTTYNLTACCQRAGIELIDAHDALNDVKGTKELFFYFTNGLRSGDTQNTEETTKHTRIRNNFNF